MTTITTRSGKGSPLTNAEVDANFTNLNDDKVEASGDSMTGDLSFGDNNKAIFGGSQDLQIYHYGSHSYVDDQGTGQLRLRGTTQIQFLSGTNDYMATMANDGAVTLYYDNAAKLATFSGGVSITGTVASDGLSIGDGDVATFGNSNDLQIYHDGTHSYIDDAGTGNLKFKSNGNKFNFVNASDQTAMYIDVDAETKLYYNVSEKLATSSSGIDVTGTVTASHLTLSDSFPVLKIEDSDGTNQKLEIVSSAGASFFTARNGSSNGTINLRRTDGTTTSRTMQVTAAGDVALYADDGTTQAFYWDASTSRLGLGTTSPSSKLHVQDTNSIVYSEGTGGYGSFYAKGSGTNAAYLFMGNAGGEKGRVQTENDGTIVFSNTTSATERMRIDSSGNVGINNDNPQGVLHVNGDSAYGEAAIFQNNGDAVSWARADWLNNQASGAGIVYRDQAGSFVFRNDNSTGTAMTTRIVAGGTTAGNIVFNKDATVTGEVGRFDSSGDLLVGTTDTSLHNATSGSGFTTNATSGFVTSARAGLGSAIICNKTGQTTAQATDYIEFRNQGTAVGEITYDGTDVSLAQVSDARLKQNVADAEDAGGIIDAIQVRSFGWVNDARQSKRFGFVAQELHSAFPEAVKEGGENPEDNPWTINEAKLIPVLLKEIQSLRARVAQLEND
jgi:hypothetical protein